MSAPSRQRIFGAKPAVDARRRPVPAAAPAELHHNSGKLISWSAFSAIFAAASLWAVATGGSAADHPGRGALVVQLLGPQGLILLFSICGLGSALLCGAYLRLLLSRNRLAASATAGGLVVNGVWGRGFYAWRDVVAVRLHISKPRSREIVFISIDRLDGGFRMVSTNTVAGGRAEVETWIQQVQSFLHR